MRRSYRSYRSYEFEGPTTEQVKKLFAAMRKLGFVARMNYQCCSSCAGYGLATYIGEKVAAGKMKPERVAGVLFFHQQDTESWEAGRRLMLRYGPVDSTQAGTVGKSDVECGQMIMAKCKELGIAAWWNGDGSQGIELFAREELVQREQKAYEARLGNVKKQPVAEAEVAS